MAEDLATQLAREDTERQLMITAFSRNLKQKLVKAAKLNEDLTPFMEVVNVLINEVAKMRVEIVELKMLKTVNAQLERKALRKLLNVLDEHKSYTV